MYKDIIGKRFGRLTVIKFSHRDKSKKHIFWLCKCNCGNIIKTTKDRLQKGDTKSCGCLRKELTQLRFTKHKMSGSSIYHRWQHMKNRCLKIDDKAYKNYGGRGIKVCDRWLKFENFYEDMSIGYKIELTLDRIDNNGNYCKENCRWATRKEQGRNTRRNKIITYQRKTLCMKEWAKELNMKYGCLWYRLNAGWSIEKAFTQKVK